MSCFCKAFCSDGVGVIQLGIKGGGEKTSRGFVARGVVGGDPRSSSGVVQVRTKGGGVKSRRSLARGVVGGVCIEAFFSPAARGVTHASSMLYADFDPGNAPPASAPMKCVGTEEKSHASDIGLIALNQSSIAGTSAMIAAALTSEPMQVSRSTF